MALPRSTHSARATIRESEDPLGLENLTLSPVIAARTKTIDWDDDKRIFLDALIKITFGDWTKSVQIWSEKFKAALIARGIENVPKGALTAQYGERDKK